MNRVYFKFFDIFIIYQYILILGAFICSFMKLQERLPPRQYRQHDEKTLYSYTTLVLTIQKRSQFKPDSLPHLPPPQSTNCSYAAEHGKIFSPIFICVYEKL